MAPRGRKPQFVPKKLSLNGNYKVYVPRRGMVDLGTADEREALTKAHQIAMEHTGGTLSQPTTPQAPTAAPAAQDMLTAWTSSPTSSTQSPPVSSAIPSPPPSSSLPPTQQQSLGFSVSAPPSVASKVEQAMPQDKRRKVADLLAGVATRLNVVAVAASVKLLGRVPASTEDEDAEAALKEGWALQLEDLFVNHPPAPWMIILGGSAAIGLGMYTNGTPIPKRPKLTPPGTFGSDGDSSQEQLASESGGADQSP